jgi:transposase
VRQLQQGGATWLRVEWLPGYASDLNPVEAHWTTSKNSRLANYVPDHLDDIYDAVTTAVGDAALEESLLQSFFRSTRLCL